MNVQSPISILYRLNSYGNADHVQKERKKKATKNLPIVLATKYRSSVLQNRQQAFGFSVRHQRDSKRLG
jgi:hypothetical protein